MKVQWQVRYLKERNDPGLGVAQLPNIGPCFQLAFRLRSSPSAVRGPVLIPPCIRQRPFGIAGALQGLPVRRDRARSVPLPVPRVACYATLKDGEYACYTAT
jgi:hypothetical protein